MAATDHPPRVHDDWYVLAESSELRARPLARALYDTPIVLFRDARGVAHALLDRCPHRNVPLSLGAVRGPELECAYHGWRFDGGGTCQAVPGLCRAAAHPGRRVPSFATREADGFVWVYGVADEAPARAPYPLPLASDARYVTVRQQLTMPGSVHAVAENALDVPHTAFVHRGLFRGTGEPSTIEVIVERDATSAVAEYVGEARPGGLLGRVLGPGGGVVRHFDRFILPSVAQVEYALGEHTHLVATTLLTPVSDYETRLYGVFAARFPFAAPWVARAVKPLAMRVLRQDVAILGAQTAAVRRFGGERYASTEIDVLGPHIDKLLRRAAAGARDVSPASHRVTMRA
ncbi:MAG: aromatic ring-hydroxylating dioxygenase subunit alpha [Myxococcales bacterium]|nr:aromatic ring-hydroxylating dioxygenase subunit alpha [Myxococcales bacterium]